MSTLTLPTPAATPSASLKASHSMRFNRMMTFVLTALILFEVILAERVHLIGLMNLLASWPGLLVLLAVLRYCHWRKLAKLIAPCELVIWSVLLTTVLSLLIQIAGRSPQPLVDAELTAIDGWMHFSTASVIHLEKQMPVVQFTLAIVYALLPLFMVAALMLPSLFGHAKASQRYLLGIVIAAILTAVLFALFPAAGPWTTEHFAAAEGQASVTSYLALLKSPNPVVLNMQDAGIVSFPSFHVVLAILSAIALGSIRPLLIPSRILAALICVSTIATGWHYGIDVIGGLIVAGMSIAVANWILHPHLGQATNMYDPPPATVGAETTIVNA